VQTLVSGGAGSKHTNQGPTMLRGNLGIDGRHRCRLEDMGVQQVNSNQLVAGVF